MRLTLIAIGTLLSGVLHAESGNLFDRVASAEISGKDRFLFLRRTDPDSEVQAVGHHLLNEVSVRADHRDWSASIGATNRLDFSQTVQPKALQLEKKLFTWESRDWNVQLGDSYQELGRGIALALYRDEVFGIDSTLEGAAVRYQSDVVRTSVFAGRIHPWQSPVALNPVTIDLEGRMLVLAGTSVGVTTDIGKFSVHTTGTFNRDEETRQFDRHWHTVGAVASIEGLIEGVDLYAESNLLMPSSTAEGQSDLGYGSYAALSYALPGWRVQVEAKDYRSYYYEFSRPPTLEEDVVETLNTQDVTAARLALSRSYGSNNTATASLLYGSDRMVDATLYHGTLGTKIRLAPKIDLETKVGYRSITEQTHLAHGAAKLQFKTFPGQSFEVGYRKQRNETNLSFLPTLDDRNYFDATYVFSQAWSITLGYESVPSNLEEVGQNFFNVGLRARADALQGRAFVGQTSGGTICSGGICRQVPSYSGAYVDATYLF